MRRTITACIVMVAVIFTARDLLAQSPQKAAASTDAVLDGFIKACDVKSNAWQELSSRESVKVSYRGHVVSGIFSADADAISIVRVFFDDLLQPGDESGLASLWYPKPQDLKMARNAKGEVAYAIRKFHRADKRERVTMQLIRFVVINQKTGKTMDNNKRAEYSEAPKSARWMVECAMEW